MKKDNFASLSEKYNLVTKVVTADGYRKDGLAIPIFVKNPEIQQSVPAVLEPAKLEKYRQQIEDFLTKIDEKIRVDMIKDSDKALAKLLKVVPDFTFLGADGLPTDRNEYVVKEEETEVGPQPAE